AASRDPVGQWNGYSGQSQSSLQEREKKAHDKTGTTTYSRHDNKIGEASLRHVQPCPSSLYVLFNTEGLPVHLVLRPPEGLLKAS
ncbi:hypothetical protein NHX12_011310, partial [Muraenolepis orangiensis]